jgi:hypothetical protein
VIVLAGRDDSAFIPPLQLTKADAGNPRDWRYAERNSRVEEDS